MTSKSHEISIRENEKIKISDIAKTLNLEYSNSDTLKLSKINLTNGKNKKIISYIEITNKSKTHQKNQFPLLLEKNQVFPKKLGFGNN